MNKIRRNTLREIQAAVLEVREMIENVLDEEQEAYDNMPEGLHESERGETMAEAIDALECAITSCDEVEGYLQDAEG